MTSKLTLIILFCAPAAEVADDAYRQLTLPGLERLLARARKIEREHHDDAYLSTLPHKCWLAEYAGLSTPLLSSAPYIRLTDGGTANTHTWAYLRPVHIYAVRDYLVMPDLAQFRLETVNADAPCAAITPLVDEMGITLDVIHTTCWYVTDSPFGDLTTVAPQRATGYNIDIRTHKGEQERAWHKFQNEIQTTWYDHSANQAREARGLLPVNSVWLFGQGALADVRPIAECMIDADPSFASLCHAGYAAELYAETLVAVPFDDTSTAAPLGDAGKPYLSASWYNRTETLRAYDRDWFSFAADALADDRIDAVSLMLTDDPHYAHYRVTRCELAVGPFGWLRCFSRPRILHDALSPLSVAA